MQRTRIIEMKMPEHSHTSRIPLMYCPFAQKSFAMMVCHTHIHNKQTGLITLPPLHMSEDKSRSYVKRFSHESADTQTHTDTNGSNSMTSTADAGGNDNLLRMTIEMFILYC